MRRLAAPLALLLASTACTTMETGTPVAAVPSDRMVSPFLNTLEARDAASFAQPEIARVTHVALELDLDFDAKRVGGAAELDILAAPGAQEIMLDSNGLEITRVTDAVGRELAYAIGDMVEAGGKGAPLTIQLGGATRLRIEYRAPADASALQWLSPEQTAGKVHPFLFSQGQAILNRTWIPTQDSPGLRQTWEARITAPKPLDVVMSGVRQGEPEDLGNGRRAFTFVMDKPVPPYLIALAAGDIDFKAIGPRTGVWAEPSVLERAHAEVGDTEEMVVEAEKLYGAYRWGRYDMIILPPAFPYGGMENPVMTFLTPTFIAGDRSNNGLVAHELAHSWSGNLVTNAVWADSWLNEGVTSYFENRIVEEVYGTKRARQEVALDYMAIVETLDAVGSDAPGTALHQPDGTDSAGSAIVYNKGAAFLRTLEREYGRERFDTWLRQWFDSHAFQPATSAMIYDDIAANLAGSQAEAERIKLREWIYEPGLPANVAKPDPQAFAAIDAASRAYGEARVMPQGWDEWSSAERQRFLQNLPQEQSAAELAALNDALGLASTGNNEELFLWLELALMNRHEPAAAQADSFLSEVGRAKFVRPLFQVLWDQGEWGRPIAQRIYARTRGSYHAVTRAGVDRVMQSGDQ